MKEHRHTTAGTRKDLPQRVNQRLIVEGKLDREDPASCLNFLCGGADGGADVRTGRPGRRKRKGTFFYRRGGEGGESMHIVETRVFCTLYYLLLKC